MFPPVTFSHLVTAAAALTAAAAVALLALVAATGPIELPGLRFDGLGATLTLVAVLVASIVAAFASRYLQDDPRLGRFLTLVAFTAAGTVMLAAASTLPVLAAGWLIAGAGFLALLAHRQDGAAAALALRRTALAFAAGDLALLGALGLIAAGGSSLALSADGGPAIGGTSADLAGLLLVIAALARCAQLPLHRWLPATVAAPTPVSALLHAGVVNGGGILLVKTAGIVALSPFALGLLLAAGLCSAIYGTAAMLARPDVKGALAHSTMAQMGFMLVQIALGALAAAIVHLAGHALYKATLFLGSGSAVARVRRGAAAPASEPHGRALRAAAALGLPALALALLLPLAGGLEAIGGDPAIVLLAFAWSSAVHAIDGWLRSAPPAALGVAAATTFAAAAAYLALLAGAKALLGPALPEPAAVGPLVGALLAGAVVGVTLARIVVPAQSLPALRATAYAWLLDLSSVRLAPRPPATRLARPAPARSLAPAGAEVAS